ncbi:hypothetical protein OnM2_032042 [Erysiphe neolycopersici]|uniref:Uncharacterized protein n=1 Tax=Erysiphe neolycopersici TaxID=212602 RepID=A0A420HYP1_9PEZI|nr:hypothetical protein OnM2_032042 [Erysiphe neolycopersici]
MNRILFSLIQLTSPNEEANIESFSKARYSQLIWFGALFDTGIAIRSTVACNQLIAYKTLFGTSLDASRLTFDSVLEIPHQQEQSIPIPITSTSILQPWRYSRRPIKYKLNSEAP